MAAIVKSCGGGGIEAVDITINGTGARVDYITPTKERARLYVSSGSPVTIKVMRYSFVAGSKKISDSNSTFKREGTYTGGATMSWEKGDPVYYGTEAQAPTTVFADRSGTIHYMD